jgi:RHS repeat-associated protein
MSRWTCRIRSLGSFLTGVLLAAFRHQSLGAELTIRDIRVQPDQPVQIRVPAVAHAYYLLFRGEQVQQIVLPRDIRLGETPEVTLTDPVPRPDTAFYRIEQVPIASPKDSDGDGMDDVFELRHPAACKPLVADASLDPDADGKNNLQEYLLGTDPGTPNVPPVVRLVAPNDLDVLFLPGPFDLMAEASDAEGQLSAVEMLVGETVLASLTNAPFTFSWTNAPVGTNRLTARATDQFGARATSGPVTVRIRFPNQFPSVAITAPETNSLHALPVSMEVMVAASDSEGPVESVRIFFNRTNLLATLVKTPFAFSWTNAPLGTNELTAVAVDSDGASVTSAPVSIRVITTNRAPVFDAIADETVDEEKPLGLTLSATDGDEPRQTLAYRLVSGPAGLSVSAAGALSWTPTEAQGPTNVAVLVSVTDGELAVTNRFNVTVREVNVAPVLAAIADQTVDEEKPLGLTLSATDADLPRQSLVYGLVSGPAGLSVSAAGALSWTPTEVQGPTNVAVLVSVTDGELAVTNRFNVAVREVNVAPVLAAIADQTVDEEKPLGLTLSATDGDEPRQTLAYRLVSGPGGLSVTAGGALSWTPTEAQGPTNVAVLVSVTDGQLAVTNRFNVAVREVNVAPVASLATNLFGVDQLQELSVTNRVTDADAPANRLTWRLVTGPVDSALEATNGVWRWTPTEAQGAGSIEVVVAVDDDGSPSLSATNRFTVTVRELNKTNSAPFVTLTGPANGAAFVTPAPISLSTVAGDPDGNLQRVEFYANVDKVGEATSAPWALSWIGAAPGSYQVFARAVDSNGLVTVTPAVQVTVSDPASAPLVTVTSSPASGSTDVSVTRETVLRFSSPLAAGSTLNTAQLFAELGGRRPLSRVELSSDRLTATLFYTEPLPGGSRVRVTFNSAGVKDPFGRVVDADGDGTPGGVARIEFDTLNNTPTPRTAIIGRVFASELVPDSSGTTNTVNHPLAGVTVTVDGQEESLRAVTDAMGNFKLDPCPAGKFFVHVDGRTSPESQWPAGNYYPVVGKEWEATGGKVDNLAGGSGEIYLPKIVAGTLKTISSTEPTEIRFPAAVLAANPGLEGVSLTVPANALFAENGARGGSVGIAPVSPDRLPGPLPEGLNLPLVITVQTDGAQNFDQPVPVCFPNLPDPVTGILLLPGAKTALWSFDHDTGKWVIRGPMTISADGKLACSDPGVGLLSPGWHGAGPGAGPGGGGGGAGGGDGCGSGCCGDCCGSPGNSAMQCTDCGSDGGGPTNPVHPVSGEKYETAVDLRIKGVGFDFVWQRSYRSRDGRPTTVGNSWDHSYNLSMRQEGSLIKSNEGTGRTYVYRQQPNGKFARGAAAREVGSNSQGGFVMVSSDRRELEYQPFDGSPHGGKIIRMSDRYGNTMRFFYDPQGRLERINDTLERDIRLRYNTQGLIETVTDFAGRIVRYAYYGDNEPGGGPGDLKSVTSPAVTGTPNGNDFPNGKTTSYTYSKGFADDRLNHNLLTITDGRRNDPNDPTYKKGPYLVNVYAPVTDPEDPRFDRVIRQYRAGDIVDLTYVPMDATPENNLVYMRTIIRDRNGNVMEYDHQVSNQLVAERRYTGRSNTNLPVTLTENRPTSKLRPNDPDYFETRYEYNWNLMLTRTIHPNGNISETVYEADLNPTNASPRVRNNIRYKRQLPGAHQPVGDQTILQEYFEYDTDMGCGSCGFNFVRRHVDARGNELLSGFDELGNLVARTNRVASSIEEWRYNERGQMTRHIHPDNGYGHRRVDALNYYESGPMKGYLRDAIVDFGGLNLTTTYEYDTVGNVTKRIDPNRNETHMVVNQLDQVVREISPEVNPGSGIRYLKDYAYDANNNLKRMDVENRDENGILQDNAWLTTAYEHDLLNNLVRTSEEVNPTHNVATEYGYDANRNRNLIRFGEATAGRQTNNTVVTLYDERDLVWREIHGAGSPEQSTTQYDYDGNKNQIRVWQGIEKDPHLTTYTYDAYNRLVSVLDAMGNVTTNRYDPVGNATNTIVLGELEDVPGGAYNVRLAETVFHFDAMNRMTNRSTAFFNSTNQAPIDDGWSTTLSVFADNSLVLATINDNQHGMTNMYDGANRLQSRIDPKGNRIINELDANNNITLKTEIERSDLGGADERFVTTMNYDGLNRLVTSSNNVGVVERRSYDSRNNLTKKGIGDESTTTFEFDGLNRLLSTTRLLVEQKDGGRLETLLATRREWDNSSRVTADVDGSGNITRYAYNCRSIKVAEQYSGSSGQTNLLGVHGEILSSIDASGTCVTNIYDSLNRLRRRWIHSPQDNAQGIAFERYAYDGLGRLVIAENEEATVKQAYDSLSNVVLDKQGDKAVQLVYDGVGNQLRIIFPDGDRADYSYDALNRVVSVSLNGESVTRYFYIGPSRVELRENSNGTRTLTTYGGAVGKPRSIDDFGFKHVSIIRHFRTNDSQTIKESELKWDMRGNKIACEERVLGMALVSKRFTYDEINRLTASRRRNVANAITSNEYKYDLVGNRVEMRSERLTGAYTLNEDPRDGAALNSYATVPSGERSADGNGNITYFKQGQSTEARLTYDFKNRQTSHSDSNAGRSLITRYDALGRRVTCISVAEGVTNVIHITNLRWNEIEVQQGVNQRTEKYIFSGASDDVVMFTSPQGWRYVHNDNQMSVEAVTDRDANVLETIEYDDYGASILRDQNGLEIGKPNSGIRILYTGLPFDYVTGLQFSRTRYYSPIDGRFLSRDVGGAWMDPAALGNPYTYCGNNPHSFVDPLGLKCELTVLAGHHPHVRDNPKGPFGCGDAFGAVACGSTGINTGIWPGRGVPSIGGMPKNPTCYSLFTWQYPCWSDPDILGCPDAPAIVQSAVEAARRQVASVCSKGCDCREVVIKVVCVDNDMKGCLGRLGSGRLCNLVERHPCK